MAFLGGIKEFEPEDFRDHEGRIAGTVHTKVRELVGRQALSVKRAEARFVAKERTTGHGHTSCQESFNRSVQPDDGNALRAKEFGSALLRISSSAQGEQD